MSERNKLLQAATESLKWIQLGRLKFGKISSYI